MAVVVGTDFRAALREVQAARERVYYDTEVDRGLADAYYQEVGLDYGVLLERLAELVRSTHRDEPRYKPSLELYPWVDLQPDGGLVSLYTAERFEPEELIEADFAVLQARMARLSQAHLLGGDGEGAVTAGDVEEQLPFNCEHVVPQSWFGKAEPMRGDLHHLFACEARCNSFRSNTPFAEFTDFPTPPAPDTLAGTAFDVCGKSASNGFEPAHGKGAAARAVFYFRLRYPDLISAEEMPPERWDMLLTWHDQDPVTMWELHRNAAIFERQGNRNPFIDHPEWCHLLTTPGVAEHRRGSSRLVAGASHLPAPHTV